MLSPLLVVLLLGAFVKILTTLNIARYGLGLQGAGFGAVLVLVAFGLSLLVVSPQLESVGGAKALLQGGAVVNSQQLIDQFDPFLTKHADPELVKRFSTPLEKKPELPVAPASFEVRLAAFLVTELRQAFQLGLLILVPFVVIDILVANVLVLIGITQMSQAVVSLPLKLLLFLAVDGWGLIASKLFASYGN